MADGRFLIFTIELARYLCVTDRRGIYSEVTGPGFALLERARPAHNSTLQEALATAAMHMARRLMNIALCGAGTPATVSLAVSPEYPTQTKR